VTESLPHSQGTEQNTSFDAATEMRGMIQEAGEPTKEQRFADLLERADVEVVVDKPLAYDALRKIAEKISSDEEIGLLYGELAHRNGIVFEEVGEEDEVRLEMVVRNEHEQQIKDVLSDLDVRLEAERIFGELQDVSRTSVETEKLDPEARDALRRLMKIYRSTDSSAAQSMETSVWLMPSEYAKFAVYGEPRDVQLTHFDTDRPVRGEADKQVVSESLNWYRDQFEGIKSDDTLSASEKAFRSFLLFQDMRSANLVVPKLNIRSGEHQGIYYRNDAMKLPVAYGNAVSYFEGLTPEAGKLYSEIKKYSRKQKETAEAIVVEKTAEEIVGAQEPEAVDAARKALEEIVSLSDDISPESAGNADELTQIVEYEAQVIEADDSLSPDEKKLRIALLYQKYFSLNQRFRSNAGSGRNQKDDSQRILKVGRFFYKLFSFTK